MRMKPVGKSLGLGLGLGLVLAWGGGFFALRLWVSWQEIKTIPYLPLSLIRVNGSWNQIVTTYPSQKFTQQEQWFSFSEYWRLWQCKNRQNRPAGSSLNSNWGHCILHFLKFSNASHFLLYLLFLHNIHTAKVLNKTPMSLKCQRCRWNLFQEKKHYLRFLKRKLFHQRKVYFLCIVLMN